MIVLSEVIEEVAEHGCANISDPYGGPYLAKVWCEGAVVKMVCMANHRDVMLLESESWDDLAWHFQTPPRIYPYTRPFPFYIGKEG